MQEKNSRKGEFCRAKLHGKRVVELGAGCGLSGLGWLYSITTKQNTPYFEPFVFVWLVKLKNIWILF